jgi:hypothetical protein
VLMLSLVPFQPMLAISIVLSCYPAAPATDLRQTMKLRTTLFFIEHVKQSYVSSQGVVFLH